MAKRDSIILNDYKTKKALASGKKVGLEIKADQIVHDLDEMKLAKGPAEELKNAVVRAIKAIREPASEGTLSRRRRAGILGSRMFNATGRLVRGLRVVQGKDGFETVAPSDRLSGDEAKLVPRLFEVAKLSGEELMGDRKVRDAVQGSVAEMIEVKKRR